MVELHINTIMLNRLFGMLSPPLFWPLPHPIKDKNMYFNCIDCLVTDMAKLTANLKYFYSLSL